MEHYSKANTQLIARCFYSRSTGEVTYENYSKYYPTIKKGTLTQLLH